jgi:predicted dehydrogenase
MRVLVVGLGSIGRRHARNWAALELGEIWVCRQTQAELPEPLGVEARIFYDLDEALAAGPDVVLVTNPTSLHVGTAQKALDAGAHVLVEKPIGASIDGIGQLLQLAASRERTLAVGYNLRFHPGLARLRDLLSSRAIGEPLSARFEMGEFLPDWHPWEDYRHGYSARRELGGGPVLTFSHELDSLCWLLGRPARVAATVAKVSQLDISTEDVAELTLQFDDGPLASVHVDFLRRPPRRSVEIIGDAGVLRWEYEANRLLQYAPATRAWRVEEGDPSFQRNDMYLAELGHFARHVQGHGPLEPLSDGRQGAAVLVVALAALRSAEEGRAVDLNEMEEPAATWLRSLG